MNAVKILAETAETVTISRQDWTSMLDGLANVEDRAAVTERRAREAYLGKAAVRRDYLTADEALRLLEGENPIKVWRTKRGLSQRQLAAAANISPSYLAEIERDRKPGSADALGKLAQILGVPREDLMTELQRIRAPEFGPVSLRWWPRDIGVSSENRGAGPEIIEFPTVQAAVEFVRDDWQTMRTYGVFIETEDRKVIYDLDGLYQEIDPGAYAILHRQGDR